MEEEMVVETATTIEALLPLDKPKKKVEKKVVKGEPKQKQNEGFFLDQSVFKSVDDKVHSWLNLLEPSIITDKFQARKDWFKKNFGIPFGEQGRIEIPISKEKAIASWEKRKDEVTLHGIGSRTYHIYPEYPIKNKIATDFFLNPLNVSSPDYAKDLDKKTGPNYINYVEPFKDDHTLVLSINPTDLFLPSEWASFLSCFHLAPISIKTLLEKKPEVLTPYIKERPQVPSLFMYNVALLMKLKDEKVGINGGDLKNYKKVARRWVVFVMDKKGRPSVFICNNYGALWWPMWIFLEWLNKKDIYIQDTTAGYNFYESIKESKFEYPFEPFSSFYLDGGWLNKGKMFTTQFIC